MHIPIDYFNYTKYNFITEYSKQLSDNFILYGETNIKRVSTQIKLFNLIYDFEKAIAIETGIFEYALTYCLTNDYPKTYLNTVYQDKLYNLI